MTAKVKCAATTICVSVPTTMTRNNFEFCNEVMDIRFVQNKEMRERA